MTDSAEPLLPGLIVEDRGTIFDATVAPDNEAVAYVTSLVPLDNGTWLSGWQSGPEKMTPVNKIRLARSRDGAQTWEQLAPVLDTSWQGIPGSFLAAEMVEVEPGRLLLFTTWVDRSIPERPLFNPVTEGILATRLLYCVSTDEGTTWGDWTELVTPGLTGCAVTGPILHWPDGSIACSYESFKEFDDPEPVDPATWMSVSRDGGQSFGDPWLIARDPEQAVYYWDQRLCVSASANEFVAMFWTHGRTAQRDLNVHLLRASLADGEQAAAQPIETNISGQIAGCCAVDDGRLLAFVVDRGRPGTMTLWQSADGGVNWPGEAKLVVHVHDEQAATTQGRENIDYAEFWEDMGKWSFGHPAIRPLGTGWLVAWYAGTPQRMSLHWARIVESS
ncbi:MAG: exo-alpha-sialidase [Planctomycetaceae bacterium]|nr:exo-alpha-sialidase [Planctomycetaceae bacterium]